MRRLLITGIGVRRSGAVSLEPGTARSPTDSAGHFEISGFLNGRYLLRVRALGFPQLSDSVTLGADGLVVLAALSEPHGDIAITCLTRSPPSRRPSRRSITVSYRRSSSRVKSRRIVCN